MINWHVCTFLGKGTFLISRSAVENIHKYINTSILSGNIDCVYLMAFKSECIVNGFSDLKDISRSNRLERGRLQY